MATKYESAKLILELYNLRRETKMREARDFWITFNPETLEDLMAGMGSPQGGYVRMVLSYWDMAAALVANDAIDAKMFHETGGEMLVVFGKVEHLIPKFREMTGSPASWKNLEEVALGFPDARKSIDGIKARMKGMLAARAAATKSAA